MTIRTMLFRKSVLLSLVALTICLAIGFFTLRKLEHEITFHPVRADQSQGWLKPSQAEEIWLRTADGENLNGWFFRASAETATETIIFFHGNGGNISNLGWLGENLSARGFDVLLFDYRGYGKSTGVASNEDEIYRDADAACDYMVKTRGVAPEHLVLYGQSLGTTAAVDVGSRRRCGAVILESGISSANDMTAKLLPNWLHWLRFFTRNRFDSIRKLKLVRCPVLVTHGDPDPVIPTSQGRALYAAANEPKQLLIYPGSGHNVFGSLGDKYLDVLGEFIRAGKNPNAGR